MLTLATSATLSRHKKADVTGRQLAKSRRAGAEIKYGTQDSVTKIIDFYFGTDTQKLLKHVGTRSH